jgi:hypothetical protein
LLCPRQVARLPGRRKRCAQRFRSGRRQTLRTKASISVLAAEFDSTSPVCWLNFGGVRRRLALVCHAIGEATPLYQSFDDVAVRVWALVA